MRKYNYKEPGYIKVGRHAQADVTFSTRDDVLDDVMTKKLHPAAAFLKGKVSVKGKVTAILRFRPELFDEKPKL